MKGYFDAREVFEIKGNIDIDAKYIVITKHHNHTEFCNIYIFECQWNFGDDGETEFKFNSNSATLVISTAREYYILDSHVQQL